MQSHRCDLNAVSHSQPPQVSVQQPSGEILAVSVRPTGTVQDIKEKIEQRRGSPVAQQRLILNGATLGDGRLISGLHGNGLTLRLELRYHITLRLYTGTSFEIEVASNEPVNTLSVAAQTRGHILFHLQQLMYEEEVLERGRRIDPNAKERYAKTITIRSLQT